MRRSIVPVVTRTLAQDDELCGYKVPKGTMIACLLQVGPHTPPRRHLLRTPRRDPLLLLRHGSCPPTRRHHRSPALAAQATHNMYKEPRRFLPDRFMPDGEYDQFDESVRLFMFLPFIQGPRNCLGQWMALLEARVVLGMLVARFKFTAARPNQGVRHPTVIPIGPLHGMEMRVD